MLPPLNAILNTGVSSLHAHQSALATTGHNISNSNTDGYTRQRVVLEASRPLPTTPGQLGLGVGLSEIRRMRDSFLDGTVRVQIGQNARYQFVSQNLVTMESALGPIEGGIDQDLTNFFNAFQQLSTAPEDLGVRQSLIQTAQILTGSIQEANSSLDRAAVRIDSAVNDSTLDINSILDRITSLNREIQRAELGTDNANDFRDQRDLLVDKLSAYFDLDIVEQPSGIIDITVNGDPLVTDLTATPVQVVVTGAPPHPQIQSGGGTSLITTGGKARGFDDIYLTIDGLKNSLNDLSAVLIGEVNALHTSGFDLNGGVGGAFFTGTDAATIDVSVALKTDPKLLAVAGAPAPGDNQVALDIIALQDQAVYPSATPSLTLNEGIRRVVAQLGLQTRSVLTLADTYENGLKLVTEQRQGISGVNMDEELSNMIAYQRGYEAAARLITIIDEALDLVINRMGRVGL
jgi:flagellar hook-associated protein 1 FlgK